VPRSQVRKQLAHRSATDAFAPAVREHEKLSEVDLGICLPIQRVRHDFMVLLKEDNPIFAECQPAADAFLELRKSHGVAMPLITNELVVQLGECGTILGCSDPVLHGASSSATRCCLLDSDT
jgi:hypothetical protein